MATSRGKLLVCLAITLLYLYFCTAITLLLPFHLFINFLKLPSPLPGNYPTFPSNLIRNYYTLPFSLPTNTFTFMTHSAVVLKTIIFENGTRKLVFFCNNNHIVLIFNLKCKITRW